MALSLLKQQANRGFTLIEVLIALTILAIALIAIIKVTGDSINNLSSIKDRTVAHWVGSNVINSCQLGLIPLPKNGETSSSSTSMANQTWHFTVAAQPTPNKYTQEIKVTIKQPGNDRSLTTEYGLITNYPTGVSNAQ